MQVKRAKVLGYCMGVERALDLAAKALSDPRPLMTLGPLIHNKRVLEALARQGFTILNEDEACQAANSVVIIRAHGVSPELNRILTENAAIVIDATCPKVRTSQMKARELAQTGFEIFIVGEERHAEVRGIVGYAPKSMVVRGKDAACDRAADLFSCNPCAKTALIAQTTISEAEFTAVRLEIERFFPDVSVFNTICRATVQRQEALAALCGEVDAILVIGDRESANTRALYTIACGHGKPAYLVESAQDIPDEIRTFTTVGIAAGASTPEEFIVEIESALLVGTYGD